MSTLLFMLKQILSTAHKVCKQKHKHGKHWPMLAYLPVPSFRNSVTCPQASTTSKQAKKTTLWWRTSISNCLQLQEAKSTSQVAFSIITVVCTLPRSHRCSHSSSRLNSKHSTYLLWSFNYCCGLIVQQYHVNLYQAISLLFFFSVLEQGYAMALPECIRSVVLWFTVACCWLKLLGWPPHFELTNHIAILLLFLKIETFVTEVSFWLIKYEIIKK